MSRTNVSPRASLICLPQELKDLIVPYLDDTSPRWTKIPNLLSVSRTCRTFRATCMQFIFEDINLSARGSTRHAIEEGKFCPRRIIALTRACNTSTTDLAAHVKRIRIDNLEARDHSLDQLLPHTRCLTSLSINYEIVHFEDPDDARIAITRLAMALQVVSFSLTQLAITCSYTSAMGRGFGRNRPPVSFMTCSWTHLTVLEDLDIPPSALLGWRLEPLSPLVDVFPTSLVRLHLGRDPWWHSRDTSVHELARELVEHENWRRFTPSLKNVSCHLFSEGSVENLQTKRCALRDLLERNGLHYKEDIRRIAKETNRLKPIERRDLLESEGIDLASATRDVRVLYAATGCPYMTA